MSAKTAERLAREAEITAKLEAQLLKLAVGEWQEDGTLKPICAPETQVNAAYKLHTIYNGMPVAKQENVPPPLTPEQQAERARVQAEMLRLLQAAAKPEPLTIEGQATEEQAVRVPRKR